MIFQYLTPELLRAAADHISDSTRDYGIYCEFTCHALDEAVKYDYDASGRREYSRFLKDQGWLEGNVLRLDEETIRDKQSIRFMLLEFLALFAETE